MKLYNIKNKDKSHDNKSLFNYIPCSKIIPPHKAIEYNFKFKLLFEDIFDIIGVEYLFEGVIIKQYIKSDGNGILYRYKNKIENLFNSKIKENISLNNISGNTFS